jgi:hypothetical protein
MENIYRLTIKEPCHENWNQMSPSDKGRFCGSCQKDVVDFTSMTDNEIHNYFIQNSKQRTCGRLYNHQLQRIKITIPNYLLLDHTTPFWQKFLLLILLHFSVTAQAVDFAFDSNFIATDSVAINDNIDSAITISDTLEICDSPKIVLNTNTEFKQSEQIFYSMGDLYITLGFMTIELCKPITESEFIWQTTTANAPFIQPTRIYNTNKFRISFEDMYNKKTELKSFNNKSKPTPIKKLPKSEIALSQNTKRRRDE